MNADHASRVGPPRDASVIVAGASAGGVEALCAMVGSLPRDLAAPVIVVLHVAPGGTSVLPQILARAGRLPAHAAVDGEQMLPGHVYVAPSDHHLLVDDGVLCLTSGPRENGHRPAIDPTMRSAAMSHDSGVIGIVLSGSRDDGTAGALAIKARGGRVVVQDPQEALFDAMPLHALAHVDADAILPARDIGAWLHDATRDGPSAEKERLAMRLHDLGHPSPADRQKGTRFTCPDCGGVLFQEEQGSLVRFRCSVGHVFSPESLLTDQERELEHALWMAVRSLEDRAALLDRIAARAVTGGQSRTAARFSEEADELRERAETVRSTLGFPHASVRTAAER